MEGEGEGEDEGEGEEGINESCSALISRRPCWEAVIF